LKNKFSVKGFLCINIFPKFYIPFQLFVICPGQDFSGDINAYFAPEGGFNAKNKNRAITMKDGTQVKATLSNGLMKMIEDTENSGTIKICMYAMGDMATVDVLIKNGYGKEIKVKLLLDACADWTKDIRTEILKRVKKAKETAIKKKDF